MEEKKYKKNYWNNFLSLENRIINLCQFVSLDEKWKCDKYFDKKNNKRYKCGKTLFWWNAYNKVKHQRTALAEENIINYQKANIKSIIYSFSGLYVLEIIMRKVLLIETKTEFNSKLCILQL